MQSIILRQTSTQWLLQVSQKENLGSLRVHDASQISLIGITLLLTKFVSPKSVYCGGKGIWTWIKWHQGDLLGETENIFISFKLIYSIY